MSTSEGPEFERDQRPWRDRMRSLYETAPADIEAREIPPSIRAEHERRTREGVEVTTIDTRTGEGSTERLYPGAAREIPSAEEDPSQEMRDLWAAWDRYVASEDFTAKLTPEEYSIAKAGFYSGYAAGRSHA